MSLQYTVYLPKSAIEKCTHVLKAKNARGSVIDVVDASKDYYTFNDYVEILDAETPAWIKQLSGRVIKVSLLDVVSHPTQIRTIEPGEYSLRSAKSLVTLSIEVNYASSPNDVGYVRPTCSIHVVARCVKTARKLYLGILSHKIEPDVSYGKYDPELDAHLCQIGRDDEDENQQTW